MSAELLTAYYDAFNRGDSATMLDLLAEDVVHEPSQGAVRNGKAAFAAAEFQLEGEYRHTDGDLPPAHGQRYRLRVGAFFEIIDGRIARVSNHYNLADWLRQVSDPA